MNYYITQCTGNSDSLEMRELENDAVEKTAPIRKGPRDPGFRSLGIRRVGDKCGRENQHPERLGPRSPVKQPRKTGKKC